MKKLIHLKSEEVKIAVPSKKDLSIHTISLEGAIIKCIKHIYRYQEFTMPKDIMISILWKAHKGCGCKQDHLDISQRLSLYDYLKDKDIEDPYINQFIKETKEKFKNADI